MSRANARTRFGSSDVKPTVTSFGPGPADNVMVTVPKAGTAINATKAMIIFFIILPHFLFFFAEPHTLHYLGL
jgi:hypothetical protein